MSWVPRRKYSSRRPCLGGARAPFYGGKGLGEQRPRHSPGQSRSTRLICEAWRTEAQTPEQGLRAMSCELRADPREGGRALAPSLGDCHLGPYSWPSALLVTGQSSEQNPQSPGAPPGTWEPLHVEGAVGTGWEATETPR